MTLLETSQGRARTLILVLGIAVALTLAPFAMGLLGAVVLYVLTAPAQRFLSRRLPRGVAAVLVLGATVLLVLLPAAWVVGLVVSQAPDSMRAVQDAQLLARLSDLKLGPVDVGAQLAAASGTVVAWVSQQALSIFGSAARGLLNIVIALFGLYYLLHFADSSWEWFRRYLPFSAARSEELRERFVGITQATLLGMLLTALLQGSLIGAAFWGVGLSNPLFWGVVTAFASVLPLLGSALVWLPGAGVLALQQNYIGVAVLVFVGAVIASNVDNVVRLIVYRRVANIHPMITLVGAFAGLRYFGLFGVLLGPLAIFYFFELLRMYHEEYAPTAGETEEVPAETEPAPLVAVVE